MGIRKITLDFEQAALTAAGLTYAGLHWCELGNQEIRGQNTSAKLHYTSLGVHHTSIDLNGRDGALAVNLDRPIPVKFHNRFDVVTDYGTIEHVGNQYQAFRNVHDLCKNGGVMIHVLPLAGHWENHGRYYYNIGFAERLAGVNGYGILSMKILDSSSYAAPRNMVAFAFKKQGGGEFISDSAFASLPIIDTGDSRRTGNYSSRIISTYARRFLRFASRLIR